MNPSLASCFNFYPQAHLCVVSVKWWGTRAKSWIYDEWTGRVPVWFSCFWPPSGPQCSHTTVTVVLLLPVVILIHIVWLIRFSCCFAVFTYMFVQIWGCVFHTSAWSPCVLLNCAVLSQQFSFISLIKGQRKRLEFHPNWIIFFCGITPETFAVSSICCSMQARRFNVD